MAFKKLTEVSSGVNFNSAVSSNFKDLYDKILLDKYIQKESYLPSKTFAPSSFRCDRVSFFRLRGVAPDANLSVDPILEFSAIVGTACHEEIQNNLKDSLGDCWVSVPKYLNSVKLGHQYQISNIGQLETRIEFFDPPVKFSCDGLIKIGEEIYLLEIKTSEYQSFKKLDSPKPQHVDQIKCYCALLELNHALVLYQDRVYGETKCFEVTVSDSEAQEVYSRMNRVLDFVSKDIAPPKLPSGDVWCNYCKYKERCKQWG